MFVHITLTINPQPIDKTLPDPCSYRIVDVYLYKSFWILFHVMTLLSSQICASGAKVTMMLSLCTPKHKKAYV